MFGLYSKLDPYGIYCNILDFMYNFLYFILFYRPYSVLFIMDLQVRKIKIKMMTFSIITFISGIIISLLLFMGTPCDIFKYDTLVVVYNPPPP